MKTPNDHHAVAAATGSRNMDSKFYKVFTPSLL